jgi:hypothetical protein
MSNEIDDRYRLLMQGLAAALSEVLPNSGFALLVFDFADPGKVNYISNAHRPDMLAAMKEFIARAEGRGHDAPPTSQ